MNPLAAAHSAQSHDLLVIQDGGIAGILSNVNLSVPRNKVTVLYGPSGSGVSGS